MRALAVIVLVIASTFSSSARASAATAPFLSLPVDGAPSISFYVYDAWTLRLGLPTYSNITLGVPYDHSGTDYSVGQGTPVYAAAHGTILSAQDGFADGCNKNLSDGGGAGNNIWIRHDNGLVTAYYHLQPGSVTQFVRQNQVVEAGQQIARSSNTGNTFGGTCGGFHLHFEVRDASFRVVNPYNTDTGYLFLTDPPAKATAPIAPIARCDATGVPASTIYLPNITKTLGGADGWYTPFIVQNTGSTATRLEVSFFRFSDGSLVTCHVVGSVAPGTSFADVPTNDTDLPGRRAVQRRRQELRLDDRLRRERARRLGRARRGDVVRRRLVRIDERLPAEHHASLLRLRHAVHHPEPRHRGDHRDREVRQLRWHRADRHRDAEHRRGPLAVHRSQLRARPPRWACLRRHGDRDSSRSRSS